MLIEEMKQELIDKIKSIKDGNILEEVYRILEVGTLETDRIILSDRQKESIDEGVQDIEEGNHLSNNQGESGN